MGREMRRVPLDFDWPRGKIWEGYLNPHNRKCEVCKGYGDTASSRFLMDWLRILPVAAEESIMGTPEHLAHYRTTGRIYPHPYLQASPMDVGSAEDLGDQLIELVEGLCEEKLKHRPGGFQSGITWRIYRRLLELAGLPENWGECQGCAGRGIHPDVLKEHDAWKPFEHPEGPGFQLWCTTGEGMPVSPVFPTAEGLAEWCEDGATIFGTSEYISKEKWLEMFKKDFCHHTDAKGNIFM